MYIYYPERHTTTHTWTATAVSDLMVPSSLLPRPTHLPQTVLGYQITRGLHAIGSWCLLFLFLYQYMLEPLFSPAKRRVHVGTLVRVFHRVGLIVGFLSVILNFDLFGFVGDFEYPSLKFFNIFVANVITTVLVWGLCWALLLIVKSWYAIIAQRVPSYATHLCNGIAFLLFCFSVFVYVLMFHHNTRKYQGLFLLVLAASIIVIFGACVYAIRLLRQSVFELRRVASASSSLATKTSERCDRVTAGLDRLKLFFSLTFLVCVIAVFYQVVSGLNKLSGSVTENDPQQYIFLQSSLMVTLQILVGYVALWHSWIDSSIVVGALRQNPAFAEVLSNMSNQNRSGDYDPLHTADPRAREDRPFMDFVTMNDGVDYDDEEADVRTYYEAHMDDGSGRFHGGSTGHARSGHGQSSSAGGLFNSVSHQDARMGWDSMLPYMGQPGAPASADALVANGNLNRNVGGVPHPSSAGQESQLRILRPVG